MLSLSLSPHFYFTFFVRLSLDCDLSLKIWIHLDVRHFHDNGIILFHLVVKDYWIHYVLANGPVIITYQASYLGYEKDNNCECYIKKEEEGFLPSERYRR